MVKGVNDFQGEEEVQSAGEERILCSERLRNREKALLKQKLLKFACGTCDMGAKAPESHVLVLPRIAELLLLNF